MSAVAAIPDDVPAPLGNYRAVVIAAGLGFVSGQFPVRAGSIAFAGRVGAELDIAQGREAASIAATNALGQIRKAIGEDYDRMRLLRVDGYVASAPGFADQAAVLDGASDTFVHHLGDRGLHTRGAFPVPQLPRNAAVELMVTFAIDPLLHPERKEPR